MSIQEEFLKRYKYLYENKELILSNCIIYGIEEKHIKEELEKISSVLRKLEMSNKNKELIELLKKTMLSYNQDLKKTKPYLSDTINDEYVNALEEFILGDISLEETNLYKYIENIKNYPENLLNHRKMISDLEERRNKNLHLKHVPTFTVWKILSYIRKKYPHNKTVISALDKYYNLDRFAIACDDGPYGYYLPEDIAEFPKGYPQLSLYAGGYNTAVQFKYRRNIFEEEDNYYDIIDEDELCEESYPSTFANNLAKSEFIKDKQRVLSEYIKVRKIATTK